MTSALGGSGFKIASAFVDVHAKTDGLSREVKTGVDRATRDSNDSAKRGGSGIGKSIVAGMAGGLMAGGAVGIITGFFKTAIGGASDLQETVNKSNVIFKQQARAIEQWADTAATSMGLSKQAAMEAAAGFGNMFSQLGFTGDQAAGMSKTIVQLSADLGSFNNLPTAEVADMISAAFRGEYDSLQRLIPNISAARVEQEALAATGKRNADQLTAQEKAAATLAIVQRDAAAAAGDFGRTQDSLANQQKIATAQFQNAATELGTHLLPVLSQVMQFITSTVVPILKEWGHIIVPVVAGLIGLRLAMRGLNLAKDVIGWGKSIAGGLNLIGDGADKSRKKLGLLKTALAGGALLGGAALAGELTPGTADQPDTGNIPQDTLNNLGGAAGQIASGDFHTIFDDIKAELDDMGRAWESGEAPIQQYWHNANTWLGRLPMDVGGWFNRVHFNVTSWLGSTANSVGSWLGNIFGSFTGWIGRLPGDVGRWFSQVHFNATMWMGNLARSVGERVTAIFRSASDWLGRLPGDVGRWFHGIYQGATGWIGRAVSWIADRWADLRRVVADPVRFVVNTVWNNGILKAWNSVVGLFGGRAVPPVVLGFATGGRVPGAGTADTVPALLTPGEFVVRKGIAEPTRRFLEALNAGQPEAVQAAGGRFARFAGGGLVEGLAFAKRQHGKPYIWGGVGPGGYDCSGFISAITNVLTGRYPHSRIGATGSMPWPGFMPGLRSLFGVGWFTGNPGHTAGTLGGSNVESGGSPSMTKFIHAAAGATHRQFNRHMSLPSIGGTFIGGGGPGDFKAVIGDMVRKITDPLIAQLPPPPPTFRSLPLGMARTARDKLIDAALNLLPFNRGGMADFGHGPERVLSPQQTAAFEAAARGGFGNTFNVTIDAKSVAEMQSVADFFDRVQQAARTGPTRLAGVVA